MKLGRVGLLAFKLWKSNYLNNDADANNIEILNEKYETLLGHHAIMLKQW
jgi:hypothetical protein